MSYWYNVSKGLVEDDSNKSRGDRLMGPYATSAEAANALESARTNTEKWDAEDRTWEEGGESGE
jgi:hypothetical protein